MKSPEESPYVSAGRGAVRDRSRSARLERRPRRVALGDGRSGLAFGSFAEASLKNSSSLDPIVPR